MGEGELAMSDEKPKTRKDFETALIARAWKDEEFKKRLISNPRAVFEEELGKLGGGKLPPEMEIKILVEDAKHIYMVLPQNPGSMELELTDQQLEGVSGGAVSVNVNLTGTVSVA